MADRIVQEIGFEATKAISNINNLTTALGSLNTALAQTKSAAGQASGSDRVIRGFAGVDKAAQKAKAGVKGATDQVKRFGKEGGNAVQTVRLRWQDLAKALAARTAVQAITRLTSELVQAAETAREFELSIARISNIAKGSAGTVQALDQAVRDLSISTGRDLAEVSEATWEALQNDHRLSMPCHPP
jgi:hypothetical protein